MYCDHNGSYPKVCLLPRVPCVPREDCRERGGDHPVRAREEQV